MLRREQRISQVEHFLIEHHKDFHEFWNRDGNFAQEISALRYAGIIFLVNDRVLIPEEVRACRVANARVGHAKRRREAPTRIP